MTAMARPTRLMRGKEGAGTAAELDEAIMGPEEKALLEAYRGVVAKVGAGASIADFLEACTLLADPVDAFFENVRASPLGPRPYVRPEKGGRSRKIRAEAQPSGGAEPGARTFAEGKGTAAEVLGRALTC